MLLTNILAHGSCKLFKITKDKNEYKRLRNTLANTNKIGKLDEDIINDALMADALIKLAGYNEAYLLHDPSPIRKPHSTKTKNLGKVTDLNGKIINGYSTHNIVAVTPQSKTVQLLFHESYSNKDKQFLKAEHVKKIKEGKTFKEKESAYPLYESNQWFNKKTLTKAAIKKVSKNIKAEYPNIALTHVLDREFDDDEYFSFLSNLNDNFIIRSKKSRSTSQVNAADGKKDKLINSLFQNNKETHIQKIRLKKQCYQDVALQIEWDKYQEYTAIKVTFKNKNGVNIFKDSMLLITNKHVGSFDDAQLIYQIYLQRSRIECVFKSLKDGLGWEDMQLQDFKAIQNLLSICFFLAAYLYEIGEQTVHDNYIVILAKLGGGKGVVSRHYILEGIHNLIAKHRVDRMLKEEKATEDEIDNMLSLAGIKTMIDF